MEKNVFFVGRWEVDLSMTLICKIAVDKVVLELIIDKRRKIRYIARNVVEAYSFFKSLLLMKSSHLVIFLYIISYLFELYLTPFYLCTLPTSLNLYEEKV